MKSALRLVILMSGCVQGLLAQGVAAGIKGGMGQGGFTGRSEFSWAASGFNAAMFVSIPLSERVSLQPELSVSQKVGQSEVGGSTLTYTGDYVNISELVRVDYRKRGNFTPFVIAGPSLTFRAGCGLQLVVADQVSNFGCEQRSALSRLDFGVVAGAGVSRNVGVSSVSIEARSTLNLRSVALPDGSGFGRGFGWAILAGASVPIRALQFRAAARTATNQCYATQPAMPAEAAGSPDADARGTATPACQQRPVGGTR